jgi:phosphoglycolate phosphatase
VVRGFFVSIPCFTRRTVLFDWDGTIVDSIRALFDADEAICRKIGIPFDLETFRRTFSPNWRLMYRTLGIPEDRHEEAEAVWAETFRGDLTEPFPGVCDALARLAAAGHRLGLVTGGSRSGVEPQLERVGVAGLIGVRVYGEDSDDGKPHPGPLLLAIERAASSPAEAVYVGDALDDMRMAAAAGVRGVGIVSMLATAQELLAAGATDTAESVVEWVDRLLGPVGPGDAVTTARV